MTICHIISPVLIDEEQVLPLAGQPFAATLIQGAVNVQNESQYEIPAHQLLMNYEGKRVGEDKDLGEAIVVNTIFGKAKVRVIYKHDNSGWLWPLAILAVLGVIVAIWLWQDVPQPTGAIQNEMLPTVATSAVQESALIAQPAPENNNANVSQPMQQNLYVPPLLKLPTPQSTLPKPGVIAAQPVLRQQAMPQPVIHQRAIPRPSLQQPTVQQLANQQLMNVAPVKQFPVKKPFVAAKPQTQPDVAGNNLPLYSEGAAQTGVSSDSVPVSIKPAAMQPSIQITKNPQPLVGGDQPPAQTGIQP